MTQFTWLNPVSEEDYLRQAADAEKQAASSTDPVARASWLNCASTFRAIARLQAQQCPSPSSKSPGDNDET
jgi:hypothetical protein